jgi:hypothetical protein
MKAIFTFIIFLILRKPSCILATNQQITYRPYTHTYIHIQHVLDYSHMFRFRKRQLLTLEKSSRQRCLLHRLYLSSIVANATDRPNYLCDYTYCKRQRLFEKFTRANYIMGRLQVKNEGKFIRCILFAGKN